MTLFNIFVILSEGAIQITSTQAKPAYYRFLKSVKTDFVYVEAVSNRLKMLSMAGWKPAVAKRIYHEPLLSY